MPPYDRLSLPLFVSQLNASIDEVAGKLKVPEGASNNSPIAEAMKLKT